MMERGRALVSQNVSQAQFIERLDVSDLGWDYSDPESFVASSIPNLYRELSAEE